MGFSFQKTIFVVLKWKQLCIYIFRKKTTNVFLTNLMFASNTMFPQINKFDVWNYFSSVLEICCIKVTKYNAIL